MISWGGGWLGGGGRWKQGFLRLEKNFASLGVLKSYFISQWLLWCIILSAFIGQYTCLGSFIYKQFAGQTGRSQVPGCSLWMRQSRPILCLCKECKCNCKLWRYYQLIARHCIVFCMAELCIVYNTTILCSAQYCIVGASGGGGRYPGADSWGHAK